VGGVRVMCLGLFWREMNSPMGKASWDVSSFLKNNSYFIYL
jgi:hypothetical protein